MRAEADTHLDLHHHVLGGVHADGLPFCGARRHDGHKGGQLPHTTLQHVRLRHTQRPPAHRAVREGPGSSHGAAAQRPEAHRRGAPAGGDVHARRRDGGVGPAGECSFAGAGKLAEYLLAGAAIRPNRRLRGLRLRGAAGILQRAGPGRAQEPGQLPLHGIHLLRELLQQHAGHCRGGRDGERDQARVDSEEPQRRPPRQVLLPPCGPHGGRFDRLRHLRKLVQAHPRREQREGEKRGGRGHLISPGNFETNPCKRCTDEG